MTWDYVCRLAVKTSSGWEYRTMDVEAFSMTSNDTAKVFHPLMLRSFGTFIGLGATEVGYTNSNVFPSVIADFGQWNERIQVECYIDGVVSEADTSGGSVYVDMVQKYSRLRNWIIQTQAVSTNKTYLQLFVLDTANNSSPDVAFDPIKVPAGTKSGWGYRGIVVGMVVAPVKAGKASLSYSLAFQVGMVIPV